MVAGTRFDFSLQLRYHSLLSPLSGPIQNAANECASAGINSIDLCARRALSNTHEHTARVRYRRCNAILFNPCANYEQLIQFNEF